jgi:AcrR family transcriptional regulator
MRSNHSAEAAPDDREDPKKRLIAAATTAFAERGFDAVTTRDITAAAGLNGAAINYHFGSKERLIAEVFTSVVAPLNRQRMEALQRCIAGAAPQPPGIADVVRAFIEPVVRSARAASGSYHRFHVLAYALRQPFVDQMMSEQSDRVASSFIAALRAALPQLPQAEVCWRYDFMIGSLVHILLDADRSHKLRRLSDGLCDTDDPDSILRQLTAFVIAGLQAPAPSSPFPAPARPAARPRSSSRARNQE